MARPPKSLDLEITEGADWGRITPQNICCKLETYNSLILTPDYLGKQCAGAVSALKANWILFGQFLFCWRPEFTRLLQWQPGSAWMNWRLIIIIITFPLQMGSFLFCLVRSAVKRFKILPKWIGKYSDQVIFLNRRLYRWNVLWQQQVTEWLMQNSNKLLFTDDELGLSVFLGIFGSF